MRALRLRSGQALFVLLLSATVLAQEAPKPAVPADPIAAIVDAFKTHRLVALCDAHGNVQSQEFLRSLVRDPRFAGAVNDVVVEFASAHYQDAIDRYVRGESVPADEVRAATQNTTIANEIPIDPEFFDMVRAVNAKLPRAKQLRVLLGDPPIDWSTVKTFDDHFKWLAMRDSYPAALIQTEVLAKQRRALIVYGQFHFIRKQALTNLDMTPLAAQTIVSILELTTIEKVFSIWTMGDVLAKAQPDVSAWRAPSLAIVTGTTIGAADYTTFFPAPSRFELKGAERVPVPKDRWLPLRAEDQFDAVLYLGPDSAMTHRELSASICSDKAYVQERLRRIAVTRIPAFEAEAVKKLCGL